MLQFFRPRYLLSWPVLTKFKWKLDQRNTLVCVRTVRLFWKLFRLPKQRPHWYNSAKRRWTTFPPSILWNCSGFPDIRGYVEMKLPMGSQGREVFTSLLDWNLPREFLGRIQEERVKSGLITSIRQWSRVLTLLRDRLKIWSQALVLLLRLGHYPLTEYSPGFLLAF
jgi:hypothetical protein